MADESQTIRTINWRELFPFTNIFRAFRVAIHPSKLFLALIALIFLFAGGKFMDYVWPVQHRAVVGETALFERYKNDLNGFKEARKAARQRIEEEYVRVLDDMGLEKDHAKAVDAAKKGERLRAVRKKIIENRDKIVADMRKNNLGTREDVADIYGAAYQNYDHLAAIENYGLFDEFFHYESSQVNGVVQGVGKARWLGPGGVFDSIINFLAIGPMWLGTQHQVFFLLFSILFLVIWAVFGGAIARIAAVHVARDEKMSIRAALRFSFSKLLSFVFAPIIPLLIIAVVGLLLTAAGLALGNWPFFGPIIIGVLFFLALAAGFIMALVLLGLIGGFNMMYPTIAVEGSDSFDAISRSFSYLYARPWRLAFYTLVAVIYGALTYLFVRLFIFLMLLLIHFFIGLGIRRDADSLTPLWSVMWPSPWAHPRLTYDIDTLTLGPGQVTGAYIIAIWVYLLVAMLGAFAISFYFSSNSIIYFLMRREVDATEMDDVYLEQSEEDFGEPTEPSGESKISDAPPSAPAPSTPPPTA